MSETGKHLVPYQKNAVAVVGRQLDIAERLLKERALALMVDEFNVPADGTFEEAVRRVRPDGLITIAAGLHLLDAGVTITKPLRIKGAGRDLSVIESSVKGTILSVETEGLFVVENVGILRTGAQTGDLLSVSAGGVALKSCALTGNSIESENADRRRGVWSVGARVTGSTVGVLERTRVTGCRKGIVVEGAAEIQLYSNRCEENGVGITFRGTATGTAENNICSRNKQHGIWIWNQAKVTLNDNRCEENEYSGIWFSKSATGTAENNINNRNGSGIMVLNQSEVNLIGNCCEENKYFGIGYSDFATGTAENNMCNRNKTDGINVSRQSKVILNGNRCEENCNIGIVYSDNTSGTAENNQCVGNKSGSLYVAPSASATCKNNQTDQP